MSTSVAAYADTPRAGMPRVVDTGPLVGPHSVQEFPHQGEGDFCRLRGQFFRDNDTVHGSELFNFQGDGNLVAYLNFQWRWASWTDGRGSYICFQADGNMVIYDEVWVPLWDSRTSGHPATSRGFNKLIVQDDGNVVIYDENNHWLWETHTFY
jgi:hypothetical protein